MEYEVRKGVPILCEDPLIQGVETTDVMVERRHKGHAVFSRLYVAPEF